MNFAAKVAVARLESSDMLPMRFVAEVTIACADCSTRFQFRRLQPGMDTDGATMSIDALTAHSAIVPEGAEPAPLGRIAAHFAPPVNERH
jgi:hypothetical protein